MLVRGDVDSSRPSSKPYFSVVRIFCDVESCLLARHLYRGRMSCHSVLMTKQAVSARDVVSVNLEAQIPESLLGNELGGVAEAIRFDYGLGLHFALYCCVKWSVR